MRAVIQWATRTTERPAPQGAAPASRGCPDPACSADDEAASIARHAASPAAPRGPAMRGAHGPPLGQDFSRLSVHPRPHATRVSNPHDPDERQAEALAERILASPPAGAGRVPGAAVDPGAIQRRCARCEDEDPERSEPAIQRRGHGDPAVTPAVAAAVSALGQGGEPLPAGERHFFEARLGHDLSRVRVHTDRQAAGAARALNADAFTMRHAIAFADGRYRPGARRDGGSSHTSWCTWSSSRPPDRCRAQRRSRWRAARSARSPAARRTPRMRSAGPPRRTRQAWRPGSRRRGQRHRARAGREPCHVRLLPRCQRARCSAVRQHDQDRTRPVRDALGARARRCDASEGQAHRGDPEEIQHVSACYRIRSCRGSRVS